MKKIFSVILCFIMLLSLSACSIVKKGSTGGGGSENTPVDPATFKRHTVPQSVLTLLGKSTATNLIVDDTFETGIAALPNSLTAEFRYAGYMGYGKLHGEEEVVAKCQWMLAQWASAGNIGDENSEGYSYIHSGEEYIWSNAFKKITLNPTGGLVKLATNCGAEYDYADKNTKTWSDNKPLDHWVHLLLQNIYWQKVTLGDIDNNIVAYIDFSVDYLNNRLTNTSKALVPEANGEHAAQCAQLVWYMHVLSDKYEEYHTRYPGQNRESMWFGIPLYDSREEGGIVQGEVFAYDKGTNMVIYSVPKDDYFDSQPTIGVRYRLTIPLKNAIEFCNSQLVEQGIFDGTDTRKYEFYFSNIGWEMPGTIDTQVTIYQMGLYY